MKKTIDNALQRFKEALAAETETEDIIMEKRAVEIFDLWVREKGYCRAELTMQQVADSLNITHSDLSWVCGRVYGTSFLNLRKRLRLKDAARMLVEQKNVPVAVIAARVGIPDRTNFKRQFFSEYGMNPQDWRDTHRR